MPSSTQGPLTHIDLQNTFGALFIGASLAAILFGVNNVQTFVYLQAHKRKDGMPFHKLIVIGLWILNTLHLAVTVHCVYYYLVTDYADVTALTEIVWSFKLQILIDVIIIYVVHVLYAYRIWTVSEGRSKILPIIVGVIVILVSGGISIAAVWAIYQCHVFLDFVGIESMTFTASSTFALVDCVIVSSLCYLLATSHTGFARVPSTDSLVTRLVTNAIHIGCLMSLSSIATLVTCVVMPKNLVSLGIEFLMTKLYILSFLAFLNAGSKPQPKKDHGDCTGLHIHRSVYPAQLQREFGDDKFLEFRKDVFNHSEEGDLHHPLPCQVSCHQLTSV